MKILYLICGFILLGLGVAGILLPVLPTTPFLLGAGFCFGKGSARVNHWFVSTKIYKNHLAEFSEHRSLSRKAKIYILILASVMLAGAFWFSKNLYARILITGVLCLKYYIFLFRIKTSDTVKKEKPRKKVRRLMDLAPGTAKYMIGSTMVSWLGLLCNVIFVLTLAVLFQKGVDGQLHMIDGITLLAIGSGSAALRFLCTVASRRLTGKISAKAKKKLREQLYQKLLRLGLTYREKIASAEVLQLSVEGIEQLDGYFSRFMPQLAYSICSSATLIILLSAIYRPIGLGLLLWAMLIPLSLGLFGAIAMKLFRRYWGSYTDLGRSFLDNLQGLTTLKIYSADEYKNQTMNQEAEGFRRMTMKVLRMQLSSIGLMDVLAYGGVTTAIFLSASAVMEQKIHLWQGISLVLLSAELFLPLRQLGSFFHVAANGIAASKRAFSFLDLKEAPEGEEELQGGDIRISQMSFAYESKTVLSDLQMNIVERQITALVGKSGSGKSTLAAILGGSMVGYEGSIQFGGIELREASRQSQYQKIALVGQENYIFSGSVEEMLKRGNQQVTKREMEEVLDRVNLLSFIRENGGMSFIIRENGTNLSGGQRQRLILAKALLQNSDVYIFDESTSSIDAESEADIMAAIYALRGKKTVLLISHRLENVRAADCIYVLENQRIAEQGTHRELMQRRGLYGSLYERQQEIEEGEGGRDVATEYRRHA